MDVAEVSFRNDGQSIISSSLVPDSCLAMTLEELIDLIVAFSAKSPKKHRKDPKLLLVVQCGDHFHPVSREAVAKYSGVEPYVGKDSDYVNELAPFRNHYAFGTHLFVFDQETRKIVIELVYDSRYDRWLATGSLCVKINKTHDLIDILKEVSDSFLGDFYDETAS